MTPDAAERLLALSPRPDAVQVHSDRWAMILLRELAARGVAVPADMAVVGFDDRELAAFARPALTTLAQPGREVGEGAAEVLLARMRGGEGPGRGGGRRVPMRLVQRESA
jgi:DNA-binding LacI/PurR family transcriptional regulator